MSARNAKAVAFKALCLDKARFLEDHGFGRTPDREQCSPTTCSVVYSGRNVGFVFSLDMRDDCVDVRLLQLGKDALGNASAGREVDLYDYLVRSRGYRGGLPAAREPSAQMTPEDLQREALEGLIELLKTVGADLLRDPALPLAGD